MVAIVDGLIGAQILDRRIANDCKQELPLNLLCRKMLESHMVILHVGGEARDNVEAGQVRMLSEGEEKEFRTGEGELSRAG